MTNCNLQITFLPKLQRFMIVKFLKFKCKSEIQKMISTFKFFTYSALARDRQSFGDKNNEPNFCFWKIENFQNSSAIAQKVFVGK